MLPSRLPAPSRTASRLSTIARSSNLALSSSSSLPLLTTITTTTKTAKTTSFQARSHPSPLTTTPSGSRSYRTGPPFGLGPHAPSLQLRRRKSTHHVPPSAPRTSAVVRPKPSDPRSAAPPHLDADLHQRQRPQGAVPTPPSSLQPPSSLVQPPPSHGPPRLIRWEAAVPPSTSSGHGFDFVSSSPGSSSLPPPLRLRSSGPRTTLFGFHPSATSTSLSERFIPLPVPSASGSASPTIATAGVVAPPSSSSAVAASTVNLPSSVPPSAAISQNLQAPANDIMAGSQNVRKRGGKKAKAEADAAVLESTKSAVAAHPHSHAGHHHHHDHGSPEEADRLLAALKGKGDRGSNVTVVGLIANVFLCIAKTIAGLLLNSASLLADAAHSLSDMFSDLVTLFCWKMSQKPASETHPLGYGKYETMGSLGVSVVLVGGAVGIGAHSYGLLIEALEPTLRHAPAAIQAFGSFTDSLASVGKHLHEHADSAAAVGGAAGEGEALLDPNAMWFALASVAVKEWLYRATLKIAKEENSSVLEANALHHRSDSLSSGVTFVAILGSWLGFPVLDPLGGLLVAGLIGKQGFELLIGALGDLSDRGVDLDVRQALAGAVESVVSASSSSNGGGGGGGGAGSGKEEETALIGYSNLRAVKSGVSTFVDVTLHMTPQTRLEEARKVELKVRDAIVVAHKGVKEVRVHLSTDVVPAPIGLGTAVLNTDEGRGRNGHSH